MPIMAALSPSLPLVIVEQILTLTPSIHQQLVASHCRGAPVLLRYCSRQTPLTVHELISLLHVLPHAHVPHALQAILANGDADPTGNPTKDLLYLFIKWLAIEAQSGSGSSPLLAFYYERILLPLMFVPHPAFLLFFNERIISAACSQGSHGIRLLSLLKQSGFALNRSARSALAAAAEHGHVMVLEWWKEQGLVITLNVPVGNSVGRGGHVPVIEWFASQAESQASEEHDDWDWDTFITHVVHSACKVGNIELLQWIVQEDVGHFAGNGTWATASNSGQVSVLKWSLSAGLPLPDSATMATSPMDQAAGNGHVDVLDWWFLHWNRPYYTHVAMDMASKNGHVRVLEWFASSGLELRFTPSAVADAATNRHFSCVEWWGKCAAYKYLVSGSPSDIDHGNRVIPHDPVTLIAFGRLNWLQKVGGMTARSVSQGGGRIVKAAISFGQLHALELHRRLFRPVFASSMTELCAHAAKVGNLGCLQWVVQNGPREQIPWAWCLRIMAKLDHVDCLVWLLGFEEARHTLKAKGLSSLPMYLGDRCLDVLHVFDGFGIFSDLTLEESAHILQNLFRFDKNDAAEWWDANISKRFA